MSGSIEFKVGDKVRCPRSPRVMVVAEVHETDAGRRLECRWTDAAGVERAELFRVVDLDFAD